MAIVTFDSAKFASWYPEFSTLTSDQLQACFDQACMLCNNTESSIVTDVSARSNLLIMLTAHFACLNFGANGQNPSQLVGRINDASEGSVRVSTEMVSKSEAASFYNQTKYGAAYWRASSPWRSAFYVPSPAKPVVVVPMG